MKPRRVHICTALLLVLASGSAWAQSEVRSATVSPPDSTALSASPDSSALSTFSAPTGYRDLSALSASPDSSALSTFSAPTGYRAIPAASAVKSPKLVVPDGPDRVDTVYYMPNVDMRFDPLFPDRYPDAMPMIRNFEGQQTLGSWRGLYLNAEGRFAEHPFLLTSSEAAVGVAGYAGRLYYNANVSMTNYVAMASGSAMQFGFSGIARYQLSDVFSITAFGQYYNGVPYFGMAAYPFVNTNRFGGYVTYMGDNVGVDVGVQRYMDPMTGRWETIPIVTPKVRIGDNVTIGLPVGAAIKMTVEGSHQPRMPMPQPGGPGAGGGAPSGSTPVRASQLRSGLPR